jgi:UDP-3-O-[3-hydroxymyristoyl] N-acetylglucosamine deacetylase
MILEDPVEFHGRGLHAGQPSTVRVSPLDAGCTIRVVWAGGQIGIERLVRDGSRRCTNLTHPQTSTSLGSVEHLLSALAGLEIYNAAISLHGDEVPVMDGSSRPFAEALARASRPGAPLEPVAIREAIVLEHGGGRIEARPHPTLKLDVNVSFDHPLIGDQRIGFERGDDFITRLSGARTFGFLGDVEPLRARGLAAGGSLDNALVFDEHRVVNPGGLRFPDEVVRHKTLDLIGDLALLGRPLAAHIVAHRPSHALTHMFLAHSLPEFSA